MEELKTKKRGTKKRGEKKSFFNDWILPLIIAAILAVLVNKFLLFKVYVPTGSMIPTINEKDQIFVTKIYNYDNIKRGDVIVFYSQEFDERYIKRLIGLPGDHISIVNGEVSVNGEKLVEDYLGSNNNFSGEFDVPEGHYFFLGDNRAYSRDSRYFENPYIPQEDILGKAQLKVYPFNDIELVR